ncbi:IS6 family transposase [Azospirillum sp.]|uniref:IS6 family transposase n=1 Tax=Azospirillum sp. TaxID=34012 RepID=UPI002D2C67C5|nr:IS6 family transposase [Azospirillum sp.]HYF89518.1 IS6 family transposase [Azospirillum sp.]
MLNRLQVPTDVAFLIVLWRPRLKLSLRDLAEILLLRGMVFSHEAVRQWEAKLAPLLTNALRHRRRGTAGRSWYVDETYLKVGGRWCYLYRAIDSDGALVDVYLSEHRDQVAAVRFFRSAVEVTGRTPDTITTDKHAGYALLWGLNPGHPTVLPTALDRSGFSAGSTVVAKPLLGREGSNVSIATLDAAGFPVGQPIAQTEGLYVDEGWVYQAFTPLAEADGNHAVFGVWMAGDKACGLGIREDRAPTTGNTSRFVPHVIASA